MVQDACKRAWEGIWFFRGFDGAGNAVHLSAWMRAVFESARRDALRRNARRGRVALGLGDAEANAIPLPPSRERSAEEAAEIRERVGILRREVERIAAAARKPGRLLAIWRGLERGLSEADIARELKISGHAVHCAVSRLRQKLSGAFVAEGVASPRGSGPSRAGDPRASEDGRGARDGNEGLRGGPASDDKEEGPGDWPDAHHDVR